MEETQISVKEKQQRTSKEAENFRVTEGSLASLKMTFAISRRGQLDTVLSLTGFGD